jgi:hypothetical protein
VDKLLIMHVVLYGNWLVPPLLVVLSVLLWRRGKRWPTLAIAPAALLFTWARFVESQLNTVQTHGAQVGFRARIALISGPHLGLYKGPHYRESFRTKQVSLRQQAIQPALPSCPEHRLADRVLLRAQIF